MSDADQLLDKVSKLKASYMALIDQLDIHIGGAGERYKPLSEIRHIVGNLNSLTNATNYVSILREDKCSLPEDRTRRYYRTIFDQIKLFCSTAGLSVMRIESWQDKEEFQAIGWKGRKPSEVITEIASEIETFFKNHPSLEAELTGRSGGNLPSH